MSEWETVSSSVWWCGPCPFVTLTPAAGAGGTQESCDGCTGVSVAAALDPFPRPDRGGLRGRRKLSLTLVWWRGCACISVSLSVAQLRGSSRRCLLDLGCPRCAVSFRLYLITCVFLTLHPENVVEHLSPQPSLPRAPKISIVLPVSLSSINIATNFPLIPARTFWLTLDSFCYFTPTLNLCLNPTHSSPKASVREGPPQCHAPASATHRASLCVPVAHHPKFLLLPSGLSLSYRQRSFKNANLIIPCLSKRT